MLFQRFRSFELSLYYFLPLFLQSKTIECSISRLGRYKTVTVLYRPYIIIIIERVKSRNGCTNEASGPLKKISGTAENEMIDTADLRKHFRSRELLTWFPNNIMTIILVACLHRECAKYFAVQARFPCQRLELYHNQWLEFVKILHIPAGTRTRNL